MKKTLIISAFVLTLIAQWFVPFNMILGQEEILTEGKIYKFKTQPIDPSDPFRGKYIVLNYEVNSATTQDSIWKRKDKVYVYLTEDSLGFAKAENVSKTILNNSSLDYVEAEVRWYYKHEKKLNFSLPFNRFYMEETKAQPAEDIVRTRTRDSALTTYALVAVKDGEASLKNVMVNEIPIADYVEQMAEE